MSDPSETIVRGSSEMEAGTTPAVGHGGHVARHPSPKEYIRIALILGAVTAFEVAVYYVDLSHATLVGVLFACAVVKFSLVVLWFMHLKFDDRRYARFFVMGLSGAAILYLVVLISFRGLSIRHPRRPWRAIVSAAWRASSWSSGSVIRRSVIAL